MFFFHSSFAVIKRKSFLKNRAGMSLVEILVSFGVMMILISGISAM
ncbi:MAG: prepilin-type N-terminal cleavage/methylation domain-containing protein, partial [Pseudobdellovibrionaceae bacterium]